MYLRQLTASGMMRCVALHPHLCNIAIVLDVHQCSAKISRLQYRSWTRNLASLKIGMPPRIVRRDSLAVNRYLLLLLLARDLRHEVKLKDVSKDCDKKKSKIHLRCVGNG
jgi:hypothetical protein